MRACKKPCYTHASSNSSLRSASRECSLSAKLRVPAVSRLQKLHNIKLALDALGGAGVAVGGLTSKDVVDGHRSGVLSLLWRVIVHFSLSQLIDKKVLEQEIRDVRRASKRRAIIGVDYKPRNEEEVGEKEQELVGLLLTWCTEVCATFGLSIENFTDSFADGKALCLLIHYYHPAMLPRDHILPTSADVNTTIVHTEHELIFNEQKNARLAKRVMGELGGIPSMLADFDTNSVPEEKSMVGCVAYLCSRLIESSAEIQATLIIQHAFRTWWGLKLLELKKAEALTIWKFWKKYSALLNDNKKVKVMKAEKKIKTFIMRCKKRRESIIAGRNLRALWIASSTKISNAVRVFLAKALLARLRAEKEAEDARIRAEKEAEDARLKAEKEAEEARLEALRQAEEVRLLMEKSSSTIGNAVRCFLAKAVLAKLQAARREIESAAAVAIETTVRVLLAKKKAQVKRRLKEDEMACRFYDAAVDIQRIFRGFSAKIDYDIKVFAANAIVAAIRGYLTRGRYLSMVAARRNRAAITLQRMFRGVLAQITATVMLLSIEKIQAAARMYLANMLMENRRMEVERAAESALRQQIFDAGVVALQSVARMGVARRDFQVKRRAAVTIQRMVRGFLVMNEMHFQNFAAIEIQRMWRGYTQQCSYMLMILGAIQVQSVGRMTIQRTNFAKALGATRTIQRWWRNALMAQGEREVRAVVAVQKIVRRFIKRSEFVKDVENIVAIQALCRRKAARERFKTSRRSAIRLQALARRSSEVAAFKSTVGRVVVIQKLTRGMLTRSLYEKLRSAVVKLQSLGRRVAALKKFAVKVEEKRRVEGATLIQSFVRRAKVATVFKEMMYKKRVDAAVKIQAVVRGFLAVGELHFKNFAATMIQKTWRGSNQQVRYILMVLGAIQVQSFVRMTLVRDDFETQKLGAKIILKWWRSTMIKKGEREDAAAVKIQALARMTRARLDFIDKKIGAEMIQR